ncbi:MAG TPA: hypothetical protein VJM31_14375 [Vicinamibacterales bacterium]|nr:hypothetical protein [Vicinamibacterales bacterium]
MNTSPLRSDLSDYAGLVWGGRRIIAVVTATCVVIMAALTWAVPRIYLIRSEIDAGVLAQAQPVETNLLVEAVDRGQFIVEGGRFPESMPKGLTVTWRAPSTMILEARSIEAASALPRLEVLTAAVHAELEARFRQYTLQRVRVQENAIAVQADADARLQRLRQFFKERSAAATASRALAYAETVRAASQRASFQLATERRLRQPLLRLRARLLAQPASAATGTKTVVDPVVIASLDDVIAAIAPDPDGTWPESTSAALEREDARRAVLDRLSSVPGLFFAELPRIFLQLTRYDLQVARAAEAQRAAERLLDRDERAEQLLNNTAPVRTVGPAETLHKSLVDLERTYQEDDQPAARAVHGAAEIFRELVHVYQQVEAAERGPSLERVPRVIVAPVMLAQPIWPRPAVNVAVAFHFGLAGSIMFVVFTSRLRTPNAS